MFALALTALLAAPALAQDAPDEPEASGSEEKGADEEAEEEKPGAPDAIDFGAATPLDGAPSPYDLSRALDGGCDDDEAVSVEAVNLDRAQALGDLTTEQAEWLEPRLSLLPQNPRAQTDFTAYTLEPGEVLLGLTTYLGVLSNVQLGTNLVLNGLRVYNFNVKVNAVQEGPVDVALIGSC